MITNVFQLEIWKDAHALVLKVYKHSENFPNTEQFTLTSQFKRAAISIAANIAEGFRKRSLREKQQFLYISLASLEECKYYCILAYDLGYTNNNEMYEDFDRLAKRIYAFIKGMEKNHKRSKV